MQNLDPLAICNRNLRNRRSIEISFLQARTTRQIDGAANGGCISRINLFKAFCIRKLKTLYIRIYVSGEALISSVVCPCWENGP